MTIETKELAISENLRKKVDMICRFASVKYEIINGSVIGIKNTKIKALLEKVRDTFKEDEFA